METNVKTFEAGVWQKIEGRIIENVDPSGTLIWKLMDTDVSPGADDAGHKILPWGIRRYIDDGRYWYVTALQGKVKGMIS
jgi:hypothetical protein